MAKTSTTADAETRAAAEQPICGVVRPIAENGDYSASHWQEVHAIIADATLQANYRARLVSESDAISVILTEIVSNLYNDPIVVCDVSSRNPNVMLELGMRLAFEKPLVIIADDATPFSFDISPVKHLVYPRSLRFQAIVEFKEKLAMAITATVEQAAAPGHKGYLQQFGPIQVTGLDERQVDASSIMAELDAIKRAVRTLSPREDAGWVGDRVFAIEIGIDPEWPNAARDVRRKLMTLEIFSRMAVGEAEPDVIRLTGTPRTGITRVTTMEAITNVLAPIEGVTSVRWTAI